MKVFISWSGELSQKFAKNLKTWIEQCIQSVEVFYSKDDIEKGEHWNARLTTELSSSNFGVVCITAENVNAPWIHFEAGALSKLLDSKVATILINTNVSDIKGPLSTFQATKLEEGEMFKLLQSINNEQEKPLSEERLRTAFKAFWNDFIEQITTLKEQYSSQAEKKTAPRTNLNDAVEEILQLVRSQSSLLSKPSNILPVEYLEKYTQTPNMNTNEIFDLLYVFTHDLLVFYEHEEIRNFVVSPVFNRYTHSVRRITEKSPVWYRRFSKLFYRLQYMIEQDTTSDASGQ